MKFGYYAPICGGLVFIMLSGELLHLRHTSAWTSEPAVIVSHNLMDMPPHVERLLVSGPPAELWRTTGATSGAVGTLYQVR